MCPIYGCPANFGDPLTTPTATLPKILWVLIRNPHQKSLLKIAGKQVRVEEYSSLYGRPTGFGGMGNVGIAMQVLPEFFDCPSQERVKVRT